LRFSHSRPAGMPSTAHVPPDASKRHRRERVPRPRTRTARVVSLARSLVLLSVARRLHGSSARSDASSRASSPTRPTRRRRTADDAPREHQRPHRGASRRRAAPVCDNAARVARGACRAGWWRTSARRWRSTRRRRPAHRGALPMLGVGRERTIVKFLHAGPCLARGASAATRRASSPRFFLGWSDGMAARGGAHGVHVGLVVPGSSPPRGSRQIRAQQPRPRTRCARLEALMKGVVRGLRDRRRGLRRQLSLRPRHYVAGPTPWSPLLPRVLAPACPPRGGAAQNRQPVAVSWLRRLPAARPSRPAACSRAPARDSTLLGAARSRQPGYRGCDIFGDRGSPATLMDTSSTLFICSGGEVFCHLLFFLCVRCRLCSGFSYLLVVSPLSMSRTATLSRSFMALPFGNFSGTE